MERLSSLGIRRPGYPTLSAIFTYEDYFIDDGLRLYDFKQALHLYLKRSGYSTIVFYNTAEGFSAFEKDMLERFLSEVSGDESGVAAGAANHVEINPRQRGRRSGSRLLSRMRSHSAGDSLKPDADAPVVADAPQLNLWLDDQTQRWHRRTTGNRIASLDQIIYNLSRRRHVAVVVEASDQEPEFDATSTDKLVRVINNVQNNARSALNGDINGNRLLIAINADACRQEMMRLFFDGNNYPVSHPSVFMNGFFRSHMLRHEGSDQLNLKNVFPLGPPTRRDIRNIMIRARLDSGIEKRLEWAGIDEMAEQMALQDPLKPFMSLSDFYHYLCQKDEYTFKSLGLHKRGNVEEEMKRMIGLDDIVGQIDRLKALIGVKLGRGQSIADINKHMLFLGNPGTGKTTVARFIGSIFKDMGLVSKGHVIEVTREHLVAGYVGQTAIKTQKIIDSALDGILFVDEAYRLAQGGENDFGPEAVETIMKRMEDDRERLVVIFAGYEEDMQSLYDINTGVDSRFPNKIYFRDYTPAELKQIFILQTSRFYTLSPEADVLLDRLIPYALDYKSRSNKSGYKFGNGRWVRNLYEKADANYASGVSAGEADDSVLRPHHFEGTGLAELDGFSFEPVARSEQMTPAQKLDALTGLREVKQSVRDLIDSAAATERYAELGIEISPDMSPSMHMVFCGNPGTGKTTVAGLLGRIYHEHGLLSSGHTVQIENRGQIVGGYQGQTAINVNRLVDQARGGVLFIDEIYSLVNGTGDSFGREAVDTLVSRIENERHDMMVILAGYKEEMETFFSHNPGMISRFNKFVNFEDYTAGELLQIAVSFLTGPGSSFVLADDAAGLLTDYIGRARAAMDNRSGNGRWARNLTEHIRKVHDSRIGRSDSPSRQDILTFTADDVQAGIDNFENSRLRTN